MHWVARAQRPLHCPCFAQRSRSLREAASEARARQPPALLYSSLPPTPDTPPSLPELRGSETGLGHWRETREGGRSPANTPELDKSSQARPLAGGPVCARPGGHQGAGAPRVKLDTMQPPLALHAGSGESLLGLSAPPGLTWHRRGTEGVPRAAGEGPELPLFCRDGAGVTGGLANNSPLPALWKCF